MSAEPNEDLIEATIRRVAAAKAEREGQETGAQVEPSPEGPMSTAPEAAAPGPEDAEPETAQPEAAPADEPASARPTAVDDGLIEATIRRVAAARAAREAEAAAETVPAAEPAPAPLLRAVSPEPDEPAAPASDGHWDAELRTLRQEVEAMQGMLRELQARVDAALAIAGVPGPAPADDDDAWDDAPTLPRIPLGQPVRPPVYRDPSPRSAAAERLAPVGDAALAPPAPQPAPKRGLELLPRTYRITVEDKRRGVDLVPLHRALLGMDGVRDMSLLSYSNGVAIISVEMVHELDPQALEFAAGRAMSRAAKVEVHNESTMVVKLAEE